jgi:hypothetical protein
MYWKEYKLAYNKDIQMPMFIAAPFTIAKLWNQPRCPSADKKVTKVLYRYKNELLFSHKEECSYIICRKKDQTGDHHVK